MANSELEYEGYKPGSIKILKKFGAKTWSKIRIEGNMGTSEFVGAKIVGGYRIAKIKIGYGTTVHRSVMSRFTLRRFPYIHQHAKYRNRYSRQRTFAMTLCAIMPRPYYRRER